MGESEEEAIEGSGRRCRFTIGAIINYSIAVDFVAIFIACLIVIGCIGTIQTDLSRTFNNNSTEQGHICYMFATCPAASDPNSPCVFQPSASHPCDGSMVGYSFIAIMSIAFVISLVVKAILNHNLNWTLYIEVPALVVSILIEFALSVMISIGNLTTCNSIMSFKKASNCTLKFPYSDFYHSTRSDVARDSAWCVFLFLVVGLVAYVIRLVIYLKRRRKQSIQETLEKENSFNTSTDAEAKPV